MNKHGASTVVSGGRYPNKRACNYNELDPQRYAANTNDQPVVNGLIRVGNYENLSKITISVKEPLRGSHSTATLVFVH